MKLSRFSSTLPSWKSAAMALFAALLLILSFPDFEYWFLAWIAFIPLFIAVDRERHSAVRGFFLGWLFGTAFFFGTCWWLTFAAVKYGGIPKPLAYFVFFFAFLIVGLFPAMFAALLSRSLKQFGNIAMLAAPFLWIFTELARYWLAGNNWNAVAYSQAFGGLGKGLASVGGIYLTGFTVLAFQSLLTTGFLLRRELLTTGRRAYHGDRAAGAGWLISLAAIAGVILYFSFGAPSSPAKQSDDKVETDVITVQPNVPMSGLDYYKWKQLRERQIQLAESELAKLKRAPVNGTPRLVILPESPMNYRFDDDPEFQAYIGAFARRNNASVLFNSAEPDTAANKYFNSAVMIDPQGTEIAQYDKIYLVPFGEAVPGPLENIAPVLVGSFSAGREYDILPVGNARAGVMLCYESHFGDLARQFVLRGADVIIEMTNDGYLGPTPVLRQHLANAVFRAVETDRPLLRTTNVGITAYIDPQGNVIEPSGSYREETRSWTVTASDGGQTFYVRFGDWFAWLCTAATIILLVFALRKRNGDSIPHLRRDV